MAATMAATTTTRAATSSRSAASRSSRGAGATEERDAVRGGSAWCCVSWRAWRAWRAGARSRSYVVSARRRVGDVRVRTSAFSVAGALGVALAARSSATRDGGATWRGATRGGVKAAQSERDVSVVGSETVRARRRFDCFSSLRGALQCGYGGSDMASVVAASERALFVLSSSSTATTARRWAARA